MNLLASPGRSTASTTMPTGKGFAHLLNRALTALTLMTAVSCGLFGQVESARLQGTVQDQTGAVVPSALVSVVNVKTQAKVQISTDVTGNFTFLSLSPGTYNLTVEAAGFRKSVVDNVELGVSAILNQNVKLEVGQTSESVEVQASTVSVQTTDSQVSRAINLRDI